MSTQVWQVTLAVLLLVLAFDFTMAYRQRNVETSLHWVSGPILNHRMNFLLVG